MATTYGTGTGTTTGTGYGTTNNTIRTGSKSTLYWVIGALALLFAAIAISWSRSNSRVTDTTYGTTTGATTNNGVVGDRYTDTTFESRAADTNATGAATTGTGVRGTTGTDTRGTVNRDGGVNGTGSAGTREYNPTRPNPTSGTDPGTGTR